MLNFLCRADSGALLPVLEQQHDGMSGFQACGLADCRALAKGKEQEFGAHSWLFDSRTCHGHLQSPPPSQACGTSPVLEATFPFDGVRIRSRKVPEKLKLCFLDVTYDGWMLGEATVIAKANVLFDMWV